VIRGVKVVQARDCLAAIEEPLNKNASTIPFFAGMVRADIILSPYKLLCARNTSRRSLHNRNIPAQPIVRKSRIVAVSGDQKARLLG
jgi:hypothetical protein